MNTTSPVACPAWRKLEAHADTWRTGRLADVLASDPARGRQMVAAAPGVQLDYSRQRAGALTLRLLTQLAAERGFEEWRAALFSGQAINTTENRAATHTALVLDEGLSKCPPDVTTYEHMRCRMSLLPIFPTTLDDAFMKADEYMAMLPKTVEARAKLRAGAGEPERTKNFPAYRKDFWERLKNGSIVQMPVLLFAGKQDRLDWNKEDSSANLHYALFLHDLLTSKNQNVKFIIYNQAGHYLWREQPDQFNEDVSTFIDYWNSKGLK